MPTTTPTTDRDIKYGCYLVCFLTLLLSVSSANVSRAGLFLLLIFAPLMAAYRFRNWRLAAPGRHLLWLLLALGGAVGVVSSGHDLMRLACFLFSLLFWAGYLCCRICDWQVVSVKDTCMIVFEALFSDPVAFFIPNPTDDPKARKSTIAKWVYMGYILAAVLVVLILLLIQANEHIADILLAASSLAVVRAPLLISCMVLALFPAAMIYSFVTQLEAVAKSYDFGGTSAVSADGEVDPATRNFPWFGMCVLIISANWFLMIVEIFYTWYLRENPLAQDYGFYDIFVIYTMIFLSMAVMLYQIFASERVNRMLFVMLGLSDAGLIVIVCFRLYAYVKFHGLWADRSFFVITLFLCTTAFFCMLVFPYRQPVQFI